MLEINAAHGVRSSFFESSFLSLFVSSFSPLIHVGAFITGGSNCFSGHRTIFEKQ